MNTARQQRLQTDVGALSRGSFLAPVLLERVRAKLQACQGSALMLAFIATGGLVSLATNFSMHLLNLRMQYLGASEVEIGFNAASQALGIVLAAPFATRAVAKLGLRRCFAFGVLFTSGILIGCNFISNFALLAFARLLFALGLAVLFTLSEALVITSTVPENRGRVIGWYATSLAVGTAAGPALVALTGVTGAEPFLYGSALFAFTMIPLLLWVDPRSLIAPVVRTSTFAAVRVIPIAFLTAFVFGILDNGGMSMLSVYSTLNGYDYRSAVILVAAATIGGIFLQLPLGYASNKHDPRIVLLGCGVGAIIAVTLLPMMMAHFAGALGTSFVFGGLLEGLYTVGLMCIAKYCRSIGIASANGCFVSFCGFGEFVGPLVTGASTQLLGPNGFVLSLTFVMVVYVAMFGLVDTDGAKRQRLAVAETA